MQIKAKYGVELCGHIYRKGETCDFKGAVTPRIKDNFTAADGSPLTIGAGDAESPVASEVSGDEDKIAKTVATLKRDGITRQLEAMNITYSSKSRTEYLAKLLLMAKGEIEE